MKTYILFENKISLEWKDIQVYRDKFTKILENVMELSHERVSTIVLVISELLENVVKYTSNHICFFKIYLEYQEDKTILNILSENDILTLKREDYKVLLSIVEEINKYDTYEELFVKMVDDYLNESKGKLRFGLALIKKLIDNNPIIIKEGTFFEKGIQIHLQINLP